MNELIRSLIECMKKETAHYRKLVVLAEQQKDLLVAGKVDSLTENIRLEEKEVFALNPLIAERKELLAQMAKLHQLKAMGLDEAVKRCPIEEIEDLKKAVMELVQSARHLEEMNQGNEKLLNNALSYADFTLKLIANGGKKKNVSPLLTTEEKKSSFVDRVI
jgi:flagellar biosynthesis/type III secretory pathway chaperone